MKMPPESAPYDDLVEATGINKRSKEKTSAVSRKKTVSAKVAEPKSLAIKVHFRDKRDW